MWATSLLFLVLQAMMLRKASTFRIYDYRSKRLSLLHASHFLDDGFNPSTNLDYSKRRVSDFLSKSAATVGPIAASALLSTTSSKPSVAANTKESNIQSNPMYTTLGDDMKMCRVMNGMWQVSGAHGYNPERDKVVADMTRYADRGFTTFDLADIYGPAENYVGSFSKGLQSSSVSKSCQFFTKWVPRPQDIDRKIVAAAMDKSLFQMKRDAVDLLQFHWWDYDNLNFYNAMDGLMHMQDIGKVKLLGLCNFDTVNMEKLVSQDAPIVSNQVSYSILDTRPAVFMQDYCREKNIKLLCYGTLLGGFLSEYWIDKPEPHLGDPGSAPALTNVSLRKYLLWIQVWGGWGLFQELLRTLRDIGRKHQVSLSNVAVRYVLEQPMVAGAIVGARFGFRDHLKDNEAIFRFSLDAEDYEQITRIQKKSKDKGLALMNTFGDCGGEYHTPSQRNKVFPSNKPSGIERLI